MKKFVGLFLLLFALTIKAQIISVDKVTVTVSNVDTIKSFYTKLFNAKEIASYAYKGKAMAQLYHLKDTNTIVKTTLLQIGNEQLELQSFNGKDKQRTIPEDSKSNDLWFQHIAIVVSDMDKAYGILKTNHVAHVSTSPQTLPGYLTQAAGISAFYFRDPDGHNLEIIHFPKGKGNPKWQGDNNLFEGIDHTAIGVSNTDAQYKFYQDILGMSIGGHSENYGTEQEHLNQVFGARLWITGMKAPKGVGVEFLQYIAPPGGRKYPLDSKVSDLWHWHTTVKVEDIEKVYLHCKASKFPIVSSGIVNCNFKGTGYTKAFMTRDFDGHAVLVTN